ncbi:hypothetical protein LCGC14_2712450 [marine sediment metagenome]|uniref:DUF2190 domain-containing protein n=1 Tax=marine sediment metagenome TaxID=412755 RepID=A0A0F8ZCM2_9ZZZZ
MAIATQIIAPRLVVTRVCAEATNIPKGTVMKLSGTNTVIASSANEDPFGGITIEEFTGGEGLTHVSCAMDGVWQMTTTAAAIAVGQMVMVGGANALTLAVEADYPKGCVVGQAEEARTGTNSIRVRVGVF